MVYANDAWNKIYSKLVLIVGLSYPFGDSITICSIIHTHTYGHVTVHTFIYDFEEITILEIHCSKS